ncbi:MAG TPA: response regulator [Chitinophagaceae bacterium]|jgi:DNA-binding NarL/FixJ family response regulator
MYRVAIADDHALFRHTLALFLKTPGNLDIVTEASNGEDLMKQLSMVGLLPDVFFIDIQMPVMDGRRAAT